MEQPIEVVERQSPTQCPLCLQEAGNQIQLMMIYKQHGISSCKRCIAEISAGGNQKKLLAYLTLLSNCFLGIFKEMENEESERKKIIELS